MHNAIHIWVRTAFLEVPGNVFVGRLWRSLKYEEVYLNAYDTVAAATTGIGKWMEFFNQSRRHSSLDRKTPDQVYYDLPSGLPLVA